MERIAVTKTISLQTISGTIFLQIDLTIKSRYGILK